MERGDLADLQMQPTTGGLSGGGCVTECSTWRLPNLSRMGVRPQYMSYAHVRKVGQRPAFKNP